MMGSTKYARYRTLKKVFRWMPEITAACFDDKSLLRLPRLTQQAHRVQRALRRFLMLEISKHVPARCKVFPNTFDHRTAFFPRITRFPESVVNERPGDHIRRGALF